MESLKDASLIDYGNNLKNESENEDTFNKNMWDFFRQKAALKFIPLTGHFELTVRCNLDCRMCYIHLTEKQMNGKKELSPDQWIRLIDEAIDHGMIFASLTGGECLTYPYFKEIYLHLYKRGILINVLTNGVLLGKFIDFFDQNPPSLIQVSVYGNNEKDYERVTGHRHWKMVRDNIDKAVQRKLPVSVAITPNRYLTDIIDIVKYYKNQNIPVSVAQWLIPANPDTERQKKDYDFSLEDSIRISEELNLINGIEKYNNCSDLLPETGGNYRDNVQKGISCSAGRCDFTIRWDGSMLMCPSLKYITGYPLEEGFKNSWEKANKLAESFRMPVECNGCAYYKVCSHCPANHLSGAPEGHCNPLICKEAKLMVQHGISKL